MTKNRMNKMNKRGDVPVTILVLGVVAICVLAIFSFYTSSQKVSKNFDIEPVKQIKLIREKISFYENLGLNQGEIDSILGIKTDSQGRYVYIEAKGISVRYDLPRD